MCFCDSLVVGIKAGSVEPCLIQRPLLFSSGVLPLSFQYLHMAASKDSFADEAKTVISTPQHFPLSKAQPVLRGLAILLTAASIAVTVTNTQSVTIFTISFEAHYYYSSAFKFLVAAEAIVCASSVLTLIILHLRLRREASSQPTTRFYFFLFLHDTVMTVLMIAGCAAATAIGYVGQYGESHMGWEAICGRVGKFCKTNVISLLLSYLAFFAYLALTLLTPYNFISPSLK